MTCSALQSLDPGRKKAANEDGRSLKRPFLFPVFSGVFPFVLFLQEKKGFFFFFRAKRTKDSRENKEK